MVLTKMAFGLAIKSVNGSNNPTGLLRALRNMPQISAAPLAALANLHRQICSQEVTKNMQYHSVDKFKLEVDPKTLKMVNRSEKPLCIILGWLLARQKHIKKYANIYMEQGFDVLSVVSTPWQLMWPMKGSQLVAADLLRFMSANMNYSPLVVQGFSVGGYIWGELCMHAMSDKQRYGPVLDRVAAQVWDSAADISELTVGVPKAVFPKNAVMQKALEKYLVYHMKSFHEQATVHYMRASQTFHCNPCRAPALFLLSSSDPVGSESSNRRARESWDSMGIKTSWKCWDHSPHVQHYTKHPKEYVAALFDHLNAVGLVSQPEKMQLRL